MLVDSHGVAWTDSYAQKIDGVRLPAWGSPRPQSKCHLGDLRNRLRCDTATIAQRFNHFKQPLVACTLNSPLPSDLDIAVLVQSTAGQNSLFVEVDEQVIQVPNSSG